MNGSLIGRYSFFATLVPIDLKQTISSSREQNAERSQIARSKGTWHRTDYWDRSVESSELSLEFGTVPVLGKVKGCKMTANVRDHGGASCATHQAQEKDEGSRVGPVGDNLSSLTLETGHQEVIHDARMDLTGKKLATASADRTIRIFDLTTCGCFNLVGELVGHTGPVWQISWADPKFGCILASCSFDRTVVIWKEETSVSFSSASGSGKCFPLLTGVSMSESQAVVKWEQLYKYKGHESSVNSVSWGPSEYGLILACASADSSVSILRFWDADSSWAVTVIPNTHGLGCNTISWCPYIYSGGVDSIKRFATGGNDDSVKAWRENPADVWKEEATLFGHSDWVRDVAWSPCYMKIASASQDRRVIIWSQSHKKGSNAFTWAPETLHIFEDVIWNVSWSFTGDQLAVSGGENSVSLWRYEGIEGEGRWRCISLDDSQSVTREDNGKKK